MLLEKTRSRSRTQKTKKPSKKQKPIPRKSRFKANENPFKIYKAKHTPDETRQFANTARQTRLANPTQAEIACEAILKEIGVKYEKEHIIYYADRFAIFDFYVRGCMDLHRAGATAIEIDGKTHNLQQSYDKQRDSYFEKSGIKTIRFTNNEILKDPKAVKEKMMAEIIISQHAR